ncbi:hypothetical protein IIY24_00620 [Candidatus Saccharibacteria bacterium]|nr:hypothetical protein [Candidatus Saccharibacteria bacterium]
MNIRQKFSILSGALCLTTSIASFSLLHLPALADDSVVDNISITVPSSCTLTNTIDTAHTASIMPGNYEDDIGTTTLKSVCNDQNGYAIYAIGFSNDTYGNTEMISDTAGTGNIVTGTAVSGNASNWAMKLNPVSGTYAPTIDNGFGSYSSVPTSYTKVAHFVGSTDATVGSSIQSTYAVYVSPTQMAATYTGKVRYTLVHPNDAGAPPQPQVTNSGKIGYFPNASGVVDSMGDQSITNTATSTTLWATNFKRPGYGFVGWSDAFDYVANVGSESNPNAHIYGPNEDITFTAGQYSGDNPGLSLYAVWVKSAGNLQNWTCPDNTAMPIGKVTALTDTRDNDTYAVAKLTDGKCWMIENLRLDYDASGNSDGSLAQGYGGTPGTYGTFSGLAKPETANFSSTTPVVANSRYTSDGTNSIYNDTTNPVTLTDIGTTNYPAFRMPRYNNNNTNTDTTLNPNTNVANMTTTDQNVYGYGNYYTWHSAIANTTYYSSPTATDSNGKTSETVNTSLCPKGWRLPYGRSTGKGATAGGFSYLDKQLGGNGATQSSTAGTTQSKVWRSFPNNFLYSGNFDSASPSLRGSYGYYWSSTASNNNRSYGLLLGSTDLHPGTNYRNRYLGQSIRCITDS